MTVVSCLFRVHDLRLDCQAAGAIRRHEASVSPSALKRGRYEPVDGVPEACCAFLRETDGQRVLVALNFSDQEQYLAVPLVERGTVAISTYLDRTGSVDPRALSLRGNEGLIIELTRL
jgi:hypothetical protein